MSNHPREDQQHWEDYYRKVADRPAREFLRRTLRRFPRPGQAIDLGCGAGADSRLLLSEGWHVLAIDQQPAAIEWLRRQTEPAQFDQLQTEVTPFEGLELPPADLIWASFSLPFCHPEHFLALWTKILAALQPGGRFAGDLFGNRHAWSRHDNMSFFTKEQVLALCGDLELEYFIEEEGKRLTTRDGYQHWHMFSLVLHK